VRPRTGLEPTIAKVKISAFVGNRTPVVQPVDTHLTDLAVSQAYLCQICYRSGEDFILLHEISVLSKL